MGGAAEDGSGRGSTGTQTRTWEYDANQRVKSVTHPESGKTQYTYTDQGAILTKIDQTGVKIAYEYDADHRLTTTRQYHPGGAEETAARVDYYWHAQSFDGTFTQNAAGRLAATSSGTPSVGAGQIIELYSYTIAGAVTKKRMRIVRGATTAEGVKKFV